ncbi:MAG TPA: nitroreductase family protein, partial [Acidimicrobiia bacterium]
MDVYEAVWSRRAVRAFTDERVPKETLERVLGAAARAPSGGNLQPWNIVVVTGPTLADLKRRVALRVAAGDGGDEPEFDMYPRALESPYRERKSAAGEQRFGALGIRREDAAARKREVAGNWDCFGAPVALFCYIDRTMGRPQWADLGMYLQ